MITFRHYVVFILTCNSFHIAFCLEIKMSLPGQTRWICLLYIRRYCWIKPCFWRCGSCRITRGFRPNNHRSVRSDNVRRDPKLLLHKVRNGKEEMFWQVEKFPAPYPMFQYPFELVVRLAKGATLPLSFSALTSCNQRRCPSRTARKTWA